MERKDIETKINDIQFLIQERIAICMVDGNLDYKQAFKVAYEQIKETHGLDGKPFTELMKALMKFTFLLWGDTPHTPRFSYLTIFLIIQEHEDGRSVISTFRFVSFMSFLVPSIYYFHIYQKRWTH